MASGSRQVTIGSVGESQGNNDGVADVEIVCSDSVDNKLSPVLANRASFAKQSAVFRSKLSEKYGRRKAEMYTLELDNVSTAVMRAVLDFSKTGCCKIDEKSLLDLWSAADFFALKKLKKVCLPKVTEKLTPETAVQASLIAARTSDAALRDAASGFIARNTALFEHAQLVKIAANVPVLQDVFSAFESYTKELKDSIAVHRKAEEKKMITLTIGEKSYRVNKQWTAGKLFKMHIKHDRTARPHNCHYNTSDARFHFKRWGGYGGMRENDRRQIASMFFNGSHVQFNPPKGCNCPFPDNYYDNESDDADVDME